MSKSPSLRRIQADLRELALDPSDRYHAAPLENDMFEWHFTIRGADDTDFAGGIYHGRILLPPEYPFKPPHIIFLTKTGRFETHTKICLSFSAFHPELWQPAWGIRLILEALISFLPTPADGALGALDWSPAERRKLAQQSTEYVCPTCHCYARDLLLPLRPKSNQDADNADGSGQENDGTKTSLSACKFQKEIAELQRLQSVQHPKEQETEKSGVEQSDDAEVVVNAPSPSMVLSVDGEVVNTIESIVEGAILDEDANDVKTAANAVPDDAVVNNDNEVAPQVTTPGMELVSERLDDATAMTDDAAAVLAPSPLPPAPQQDDNGTGNAEPITGGDSLRAAGPNHINVALATKVLDPILQGILVALSILVYMLLRKIRALSADLQALEPHEIA